MAFRTGNRMNPREKKTMDSLLELIATGTNEELQHESNMFKLRNSFARDETRNISTTGGSPRRSQKYTVDDSGMVRNSRLSNSPMQCNANMPDLIKGSCDNLFNGNSQTERCASASNRGPMQKVRGF